MDIPPEIAALMDPLPQISSHLPDLVDAYIAKRDERLKMDKEAAALKEHEDDLHKTIIAKLREQGATAYGGLRGVVKLHEKQEPNVEDWPATYAFIKENDAWELLHKRITVTAVKERWDAGEAVPGVGRVTKYNLTVSKS